MRLKTADIDQEVKERAISCMGQIICNLGDYLQVNKKLTKIRLFHCKFQWESLFKKQTDC